MVLTPSGAAADEKKEGPFVIHEIAIDPKNPETLYATTSNYGILRSTNGGVTWGLVNQGLRSYTLRVVVVNLFESNILYAGSWGGGVSKSVDRGMHWVEVNDDLGNTAIEDLVLDPIRPEKLYVATTSGVFTSPNGGKSWIPYSEGLPVSTIEVFECLLIPPSGSIELLLGTNRGLFKRERGAPTWKAVIGAVDERHITALSAHPKGHILYAGTIKHGMLQSQDGGKSWTPLGGKIENSWVSDIAIHPSSARVIYASTRGKGILKSHDGGITWQEFNNGLAVRDIRSLAIDPKRGEILYAGTTQDGLIKTGDGGETWVRLTGYPLLTHTEIVDSVSGPDRLQEHPSAPSVPPEFFKCNQCHGWADPFLNSKNTYWRVPPNKRDWEPTVNRMSIRARLTSEEASEIIKFLTTYTQRR